MHPWLEDGLPAPMSRDNIFDGLDDFGAGEFQRTDVRPR
jgi:hypothetical protein